MCVTQSHTHSNTHTYTRIHAHDNHFLAQKNKMMKKLTKIEEKLKEKALPTYERRQLNYFKNA